MNKLNSRIATVVTLAALVTGLTAASTLVASTSAEARQSTRSFTCSAVRDLVDRRGSAVLNTKNARVYKRFVRDRTYCALVEGTRRVSVPTRDGNCSLNICDEPLDRSGFR
ncbi:MAG: hypothetical protein ACR2PF_08995 [Rhizobiaceae bacterium]